MRSGDAASWQNDRLDGVTLVFQVSAYSVERQTDDSVNIFTNDPARPDLSNDAEHLRPEMPLVVLRELLAGHAERLAREAADKDVDSSASGPSGNNVACECPHVAMNRNLRKVLCQHAATELVDLTESGDVAPGPGRAERKAADAGKEIEYERSSLDHASILS